MPTEVASAMISMDNSCPMITGSYFLLYLDSLPVLLFSYAPNALPSFSLLKQCVVEVVFSTPWIIVPLHLCLAWFFLLFRFQMPPLQRSTLRQSGLQQHASSSLFHCLIILFFFSIFDSTYYYLEIKVPQFSTCLLSISFFPQNKSPRRTGISCWLPAVFSMPSKNVLHIIGA